MKKGLFLIAAGFSALVASAAGATVKTNETASCLSKAMSVSMVKPKTIENAGRAPFKVTQEFDEDGKTNLPSFVSYFKVTLNRSHAYTIWIEGTDCACPTKEQRESHSLGYDLEIEPVEATEAQQESGIFEPGASFNEVSGAWGRMSVMTTDEWTIDPEDPEFSDPKSWTYYIRIEGPCDSFCGTLRYAEGVWTPIGIEENPLVIAPKEKPEEGLWTGEYEFVTNEFRFCCAADLAYGRRYAFTLKGGRADNRYALGLDGGKVSTNFSWRVDDFNDSLYFDPSASSNFKIWAIASSTNQFSAKFDLRYRLLPTRGIADHTVCGELTVGRPELCTPGHVNNTANKFYDLIVDDCLYKVTLEKGKKYVIDTDGARTNLLLYVYDSKGNLLYENSEDGSGTGNARCGFKTASKGVFYVGLAEKLANDDVDVPTGNPVTLRVDLADGRDGDPDRWDAADDTYAGATVLQPVLGTKPEEDTKGSEGWHRLGRTDWSDVFALGGRKGCAYRLYVEPEDPAAALIPLKARVFTMSGKSSAGVRSEGNVNKTSTNSLQFVATKDAIYYVELTSSGGSGIDYPNYRVHSVVYDSTTGDEGNLGLLKVWIHGTKDGRWSLNRESVQYRSEMVLPLPSGNYSVKFTSVKDFATPPALTTVKVEKGKTKENVESVAGWYTDTKDYKDDYPSGRGVDPNGKSVTYGATTLSYSNKEKSENHTFWRDDVADTFSIAGKDGYYYDIWLTNLVSVVDDAPDAVFSIVNEELGVITQNVTRVHQLPLPTTKAKYFLTVSHTNPKHYADPYTYGNNTSYTLSGFYANVGQIKFSAAEYKVKDNAAEVKLTVNRTAKDGKVRVNLWTEDGEFAKGVKRGSAVPDPEDGSRDDIYKFYRNEQTLVWANGDNKAKTVIIKLIPDKYPTFHDFARSFTVKMEDAFDGSADCYHASFAIDSKTKRPLSETQVTFQESAKKTPGTVQVDDKRQDVKKPVFDVRAGGTLDFNLVRVDGDNGAVTVKVDVAALTGVKGDFRQVGWADGDVASMPLSVAIPPATDAKTSKKVTLKLSATSKDKPKFAASSITVNIFNDKFAATLADYAKALPKTCGYTIKEGKSGTWVVDDNGAFVSTNTPSALTFTITGPALFSCKLDGVETNVSVRVVGKTQTFVVPAGVKEVTDVRYDFNFGNCETVFQAVQYGYDEPIVEGGAEVKARVAAGKLPDGIKLEQDKATKKWYVRGVPTKAGFYYAEIQDTAFKSAQAMTNLAFNVVELHSAVGTFNGLAESANDVLDPLQSLAQVTLTTAASGKLSAKVAIGGKTYSFAATGFSRAEVSEGESVTNLTAELTQLQKVTVKVGGKSQTLTYTNVLTATIRDADPSDPDSWRTSASLTLDMAALPSLKGGSYQEDVSYAGHACRDNSKQAAWVTEAAHYAGYYTIALVPREPSDRLPRGNGYLTLTLDAKGKVKIAGALADGTAYSASSVVGNMRTVDDDYAVSVPLYSFKNPTLFGGWLTLRFENAYDISSAVAVLDGSALEGGIRWFSQDASGIYGRIALTIAPVGGYYDTVASLQRYYLNDAFSIDSVAGDDFDLLDEALRLNYGPSYGFVARADNGASVNGMPVDLVGNTPSVAKQVLVKEMDGTKKSTFNDWDLSTNAANVKVTFKRATGILTGTCDFWYEGTNGAKRVQGAIKGCKHAGVLIMTRDASASSVLADDVWTAGAVVIPLSWKSGNVSHKWNASYPFNIKAEKFESDR